MSIIDNNNVTKPLFITEWPKFRECNLKYNNLDEILRGIFPSKTVRKYWKQIHFQPALADVALILFYNQEKPLCEKIALMQSLMHYVDESTQEKIQKYLVAKEEELLEFQKEYDDTVFDVQVEYTWEQNDFMQEYDYHSEVIVKDFQSALFMLNKLANNHMMSHKFFQIVKRRVVKKDDFSVIDQDEGRAVVYEKVGCMEVGFDGYITSVNNEWENDLNADSICIGSFGVDDSEIFPNEKYISLPHPFHRGDIVRDVVNDCYGVVVSAPVANQSFEAFEKDEENGLGGKEYFGKYVEILIFDEEDGTFGNTSTHAFNLEKVQRENSLRHACLSDVGMILKNSGSHYRIAELSRMLRKYRKKCEARKVLKSDYV